MGTYESGRFTNRGNKCRMRIILVDKREIYEDTNSILEHGFEEPKMFLLWTAAFIHASFQKIFIKHLTMSQELLLDKLPAFMDFIF